MIQSLIHTTENNNSYIYDDQRRLSMLIHPELKKAHENTKNANTYYLKKYKYLKSHGFFSQSKVDFEIITEKIVKESLINTEQIVFEVTDSCNLNCTYCGFGELYEGYDIRNGNKLNILYAKLLLKYIYNLKLENNNKRLMIGFYGGEPLLNINFIKQIIEFANQLNNEEKMVIGYSMTTNATLIHKYVDFLVENKFRLLISLDGNEVNHSYRVFNNSKKNSFQKVIENIDILQRNYTKYFDSHVMFNAVLHNQNSVKDIYEFIYTRYKKIPIISELRLRSTKPERKDLVEKLYHNRRTSEAEYLKEDSIQIPITHPASLAFKELSDFLTDFSSNYYVYNINSLLFGDLKYYPTSTCLPFEKRIFLTTHNKILPCEQIDFKYALGKIEKNVMIDIQAITRQYNFYYEHIGKVCAHCYAYKFCGECMLQIDNLDKLDVEEFVCSRFFDQKAFEKKLCRIFSFVEKYPNTIFQILENEQKNNF
jgi:uncharacterized protein